MCWYGKLDRPLSPVGPPYTLKKMKPMVIIWSFQFTWKKLWCGALHGPSLCASCLGSIVQKWKSSPHLTRWQWGPYLELIGHATAADSHWTCPLYAVVSSMPTWLSHLELHFTISHSLSKGIASLNIDELVKKWWTHPHRPL